MKTKISEPVIAALSLIMIVVIATTRNVAMSDMTSSMIVGIFAGALFAYSLLVHKEKPADEREQAISLSASKYSYLVGSLVLSVGIIWQSYNHELDLWLPFALAAMVVAKSGALFFHNR